MSDVQAKTAALLENGLQNLEVEQSHHSALLQYLLLLNKWNRAYNLTAIRDLTDMVTRHILDSLVITPYLKGSRIIDVGTGAGLPGIPLAITNPHIEFVLLDSNGKKTRFLNEVKRSLSLSNITIVQSRAENYHNDAVFDTVISRALSEINQLITWTQHLIAENGIWLAMKGRYPEAELLSIHYPYEVHTYEVPGIDEPRCAVVIQNDKEN